MAEQNKNFEKDKNGWWGSLFTPFESIDHWKIELEMRDPIQVCGSDFENVPAARRQIDDSTANNTYCLSRLLCMLSNPKDWNRSSSTWFWTKQRLSLCKYAELYLSYFIEYGSGTLSLRSDIEKLNFVTKTDSHSLPGLFGCKDSKENGKCFSTVQINGSYRLIEGWKANKENIAFSITDYIKSYEFYSVANWATYFLDSEQCSTFSFQT